jgi:C4-dicarboxylate-specific signal transduction histidine kinase
MRSGDGVRAGESSRNRGRELVLAKKRRLLLPIMSILAAACVCFSIYSVLIRGISKDLYIFGSGSILFLSGVYLLVRGGRVETVSTIALVPISILIPLSVFLPLPSDPNVTSLFTLAAGGMVSMILALLLGNRRFQIVIMGLISIAATLGFFLLVLLPAQPSAADPFWARSNLVAALVLELIAMTALVYVDGLIDRAFREIEAASLNLESQVKQRTSELEAAQSRLVLSEKLKLLGELVAGISHEINTPLGAIVSSMGTAIEEQNRILASLPGIAARLDESSRSALTERLGTMSLGQLRSGSRFRDARAEAGRRLSSLGCADDEECADLLAQLGLEEVDEGLAALLALPESAELVRLLYGAGALRTALSITSESAARIAAVTEALRNYSYGSDRGIVTPIELARNVDSVLPLIQHALKRGVEVHSDLDEEVVVMGQQGKLGQVWLNLITNALQAMEWKGRLSIAVRREGGEGVVSIGNDGPEIPPGIRDDIFKPFVTTKDASTGTGLGLAITLQIVEEHGGRIDFTSSSQETVFTVRLPLLEG